MAKPDTSRIDTLEAIMAEKRKHESYLAKLEDRRASTPAHVFNRLRDEYLTKLTDLQVRASMEAESLSEGLKADEAAVAEIEAKLALVTEERIEGELRAEVGEYDPTEWGKKLATLNEAIGKIEKERETKVAAFERTRSLLIEARGAAAPADVPAPAVAAPAPVAAPVAEPVVSAVAEPIAPPEVAQPKPPAVAEAPSAPPPPVRQTPMGQPVAAAPARTPTPAPAAPAVPPVVVPEAIIPPPPAVLAPPAAPAPAPMSGGPSFDELAFLNSVVGRASTPVKVDEPAPVTAPRPSGASRAMPTPSPAAPLVTPPVRATSNVRPAVDADDTSSGPLGRPTPRTSQAIKTLKCQECGTLNYPTEWYCERCGGELAAL